MAEREYSKRLGVITDAQLQAALARFDLGEFVRAEPIPFGLFGQNLFVTSTRGEFVLRGAPHYDWQFPTEKYFTDLLHERTQVPVPYPYLFEPADAIFGWGFALTPRMPGLAIADSKVTGGLDTAERQGIARALARMLVEAQTYKWEYAGKYNFETGAVEPFSQEYRRWIAHQIRQMLAQTQVVNSNTRASDIAWAESIIAQAERGLATPYQSCIVFEDYKEPNTVVERAGDDWRVSGVFDLMTAHFGDGEADLARQVGAYLREYPALADDYVQAYLKSAAVAPGFRERQQFYMLYDSVIIWEFWQRHAGGLPEDKTLTLEEWASPFVDYWKKF